MKRRRHRLVTIGSVIVTIATAAIVIGRHDGRSSHRHTIEATKYLPHGYVKDGSVDYSIFVKVALERAGAVGADLHFPPIAYRINLLNSVLVPSNITIKAQGARFLASEAIGHMPPGIDGSLFVVKNVHNVQWTGGEFIGQRASWYEGSNIRAFTIGGSSENITIRNATFRDFSAPAVFAGGESSSFLVNVSVFDSKFYRNGAAYRDYLDNGGGVAKDSTDFDKGQIQFDYVNGFKIMNVIVTGSPGDGAFFRQSRKGEIANSQFDSNHMGGLAIESSQDVVVHDCRLEGNGSRNISVHWGSRNVDFLKNFVAGAGREGLWGWGYFSGLVRDNIFARDGQYRDGETAAEITLTPWHPAPSEEAAVTFEQNIIESANGEKFAMHVASNLTGVNILHNSFEGPKAPVRIDAWLSGSGSVSMHSNTGWRTENSGAFTIQPSGSQHVFTFPHDLDFSDPADTRYLHHIEVKAQASVVDESNVRISEVSADTQEITIGLSAPPARAVEFKWSAMVVSR